MSLYPERYHARILERIEPLLPDLRATNVTVLGHTGFYGSWFCDFFSYARAQWQGPASVWCHSRSTGVDINDRRTYPADLWLSHYVINCAGYSSGSEAGTHEVGPKILRDALYPDTTLLQFSSGAAGNDTLYGYAKGKAEKLLAGTQTQIVRPFATVGPGMGLDKQFAVSAFIRAALAGKPLQLVDRPVTRSFVHVSDLIVQCLYVMVRGDRRPYEVGSSDGVSLERVAREISRDVQVTDVRLPSNARADHYVADLTRLRKICQNPLDFQSIPAILDTLDFYRDAQ